MPEGGSLIKFHNGQYQFKVPFIMYTDFVELIEAKQCQEPFPEPNPERPYTKVFNLNIPSGFCVNSKFANGKIENPLKPYKGEIV